ncbi:MAG: hypothetical protein ACFFCS_10035 [Candidatus Hodarchaeota archaeon]
MVEPGKYILFRCKKCKTHLVADGEARKTKKCHKCNYTNNLGKTVVIKSFRVKEEATNALRYIKIPEEERGNVPYLLYSFKDDPRNKSINLNAFIRKIKQKYRDGIKLKILRSLARKECIDEDLLDQAITQMKLKGSLIEIDGVRVKII